LEHISYADIDWKSISQIARFYWNGPFNPRTLTGEKDVPPPLDPKSETTGVILQQPSTSAPNRESAWCGKIIKETASFGLSDIRLAALGPFP